jgi:hypothetical protein
VPWYLLSDGETPYWSDVPIEGMKEATEKQVKDGRAAVEKRPPPSPVIAEEA